jgi:hypothetical protein
MTLLYPLQQEEERQRKERQTLRSMVKLSEDTPESAPDAYWISNKRAINLLPRKRKRA